MSFEFCPHCAMEGKISEVEYLQDQYCALAMCPELECPYNHEEHFVLRDYGDAPLPEWVLEALGLPLTLGIEPRMRYKHTKLILWLNSIRQSVYLWYSEEVMSMVHAELLRVKDKKYKYALTPSAKRLMELDREELFLGKKIIPDLVRIVATLNHYYKICGYTSTS